MTRSHHCRSDTPLDETSDSGSDAGDHADNPNNSLSLLPPPPRRPSCASTHPAPTSLCQGKAASGWLRPTPKPARMTHSGPLRLYGGTPYNDNSRVPDGHWETAT